MTFTTHTMVQTRFLFFFCGQKLRDPGSNQGPPDLQSGALPTELSRKIGHWQGPENSSAGCLAEGHIRLKMFLCVVVVCLLGEGYFF